VLESLQAERLSPLQLAVTLHLLRQSQPRREKSPLVMEANHLGVHRNPHQLGPTHLQSQLPAYQHLLLLLPHREVADPQLPLPARLPANLHLREATPHRLQASLPLLVVTRLQNLLVQTLPLRPTIPPQQAETRLRHQASPHLQLDSLQGKLTSN
jgi:hypothetical protein